MKSIAIVLTLLTGCYGSQMAELRRQNAELAEQNRRLWSARPDDASTDSKAPRLTQPMTPPAGGVSNPGQRNQTGAMVARQQHGIYMGTVGAQARQVTKGSKLRLDNHVCDRGSRNVWSQCADADRDGAPDFNTYLAFQIDGQPVVCDSTFVHPDTGEVLLAPGQTCFVELGRSSVVNLTIRAYRNFGTSAAIMLDAAPDASSHRRVDVGMLSNTGYYEIDESRF